MSSVGRRLSRISWLPSSLSDHAISATRLSNAVPDRTCPRDVHQPSPEDTTADIRGSNCRRSQRTLSRGLDNLAQEGRDPAHKASSIQRRAAGFCGLEQFRLVQDFIGDHTLGAGLREVLLYAADHQYGSVLKDSRRVRVSGYCQSPGGSGKTIAFGGE